MAYEFEFLQCDVWIKLFLYLKTSIASNKMCADSEKSCFYDHIGRSLCCYKNASPQWGLNSRPLVYKTSALATELWRLIRIWRLFYDSHALCNWHPVWTNLRQSSIDTVKTDTCKHACYADDNWLQLISILEQSGGHTSPKDAVLSQWSNPKKGCFSQLMYAPWSYSG